MRHITWDQFQFYPKPFKWKWSQSETVLNITLCWKGLTDFITTLYSRRGLITKIREFISRLKPSFKVKTYQQFSLLKLLQKIQEGCFFKILKLELSLELRKTLPEAQRTQKLTPWLGLNLATTRHHLHLIVTNYPSRWRHLHYLQICPQDGATID